MAYLWQIEFSRNLTRQAGIKITAGVLRREAIRLPRGDMPGQDGAKRFNLSLARSLHAAVSLLEREGGMPPAEAVRTAAAAFTVSGTWLAKGAIRLWLRLEGDPFAGLMKRGPSRVAKAMWGDGMLVEDRHESDSISLCVRSCPFHEYFLSVGRSDLTPILCAWDTAWQAEVNASEKPIRVDIRDTIARGGETCEFAFRKTGSVKMK